MENVYVHWPLRDSTKHYPMKKLIFEIFENISFPDNPYTYLDELKTRTGWGIIGHVRLDRFLPRWSDSEQPKSVLIQKAERDGDLWYGIMRVPGKSPDDLPYYHLHLEMTFEKFPKSLK
jgi:hypothetical protein